MSTAGFTQAILAGQPINVFNHGKMQRDFTYVDDIVEGVVRTLAKSIADSQTGETQLMTGMLSERGGTPLPAP